MIDDQLINAVIQTLTLSGLPELPFDDPTNGGFAIQPDQDVIYIVWSPSDELSATAFERLTTGDTTNPTVLHMGRIKHAMAGAILEILHSAGFDAAMSTDDMAPATVEVRPSRMA